MNEAQATPSLSYRDLFWIFFKAGMAFGGGLGILAVLEDELVTRRRVVTREAFLALYGLGRIVPSGTMSALAVAYGFRLGGWLGTVITLTALVLPAFIVTVVLTAAFVYVRDSVVLALLPVTILPAALAFIVVAALKLGREVFRSSLDLVLAAAAFLGLSLLNIDPALLLVAGGVVGIIAFGRGGEKS